MKLLCGSGQLQDSYNEWRFTAKKDGEPIETHGVDYYRFKDGLIVEKNSFRKFLF
ncbi:hypothetical protein ACIBG0_42110 [Nocardia sp. NPDC050630]|uniref:hypothetical protein n=1 Tax=Nocardia sp. NPDC050630 TaxID=3364321 RepID=UPI0037BCD618